MNEMEEAPLHLGHKPPNLNPFELSLVKEWRSTPHDFAAILAIISGWVNSCTKKKPLEANAREALMQEIARKVRHMSDGEHSPLSAPTEVRQLLEEHGIDPSVL